jgi:hypothetical protein
MWSVTWQRTQFAGIDGSPKARYHAVVDDKKLDDFYIEASRAGVELSGKLQITTFPDLNPFAKALADAWRDHQKWKPRITSTLSGH